MSLLQAFIMAKLMGGSGTGTVTDVQVNGTSVVSGGVADIPLAVFGPSETAGNAGLVKLRTGRGLAKNTNDDSLYIAYPSANSLKGGNGSFDPVTTGYQHAAAFYGLAKAAGANMASIADTTVGIYPAAQKSAISTMLSAPETVTGTTPTITALAGVQYVCGEVSTLDITLPASGCVDIRFESGSTPTVLTITPPSGVSVKWAGGFDPTALEANTVYEINIADGLGVAASWT